MKWRNEFCKEWHRVFAWLPVNVNGTTVWMDFYERKYVSKNPYDAEGNNCPAAKQCCISGMIEVRLCLQSRNDRASSQTTDELEESIAKVRASSAKLGITIDVWVRRFNA